MLAHSGERAGSGARWVASMGVGSRSVDSLAVTVVREALARVSGHLDSLFAMQGIGSFAVSGAERHGPRAVAARHRDA